MIFIGKTGQSNVNRNVKLKLKGSCIRGDLCFHSTVKSPFLGRAAATMYHTHIMLLTPSVFTLHAAMRFQNSHQTQSKPHSSYKNELSTFKKQRFTHTHTKAHKNTHAKLQKHPWVVLASSVYLLYDHRLSRRFLVAKRVLF